MYTLQYILNEMNVNTAAVHFKQEECKHCSTFLSWMNENTAVQFQGCKC